MTDYKDYEIKSFSNELIEKYNKKTYIPELGHKTEYDSAKHQKKEFVQVGRRYSELQGEWFDPKAKTYVSADLPNQLARDIVLGEFNYLTDRFKELSKNQNSIEEFTFENLISIVNSSQKPTHLVIPSQYGKKLINWEYDENKDLDGLNKGVKPCYQSHGVKIFLDGDESSLKDDEIIAIDSEEIEIIQKKRRDKPIEKEDIKPIEKYSEIGDDENLMLYFGKSTKGDIDFLFRTIFHVQVMNNPPSLFEIEK